VLIPKIIGATLIFFGLCFRGICVAYFNKRAPLVADTPTARRRFDASRRNAFLIDVAFILAGLMMIFGR
jgi:hypothetical protein